MRLNRPTIDINQFTGLNSVASPASMALTDAPLLYNMDVTRARDLIRRKGTQIIGDGGATTTPFTGFHFTANSGYSFILIKNGFNLEIYTIDDDKLSLTTVKTNIFRRANSIVNFAILPGTPLRILMMAHGNAPTQLRVLEATRTVSSASSTITFSNAKEFRNVLSFLSAKVNGVDTVINTASYNSSTEEMNVNFHESLAVGSEVTIIAFTWQWWAEAFRWFGDNFFRVLPRAGNNAADANIVIPSELISDLEENIQEYGLTVFASTNPNSIYAYVPSGQPQFENEWSYGDGSTYIYDGVRTLTPSPSVVTFGRPSTTNLLSIVDEDITAGNNRIRVFSHEMTNKEEYRFTETTGYLHDGFQINTSYFARVLDENEFELHTTPSINFRVVITPRITVNFTDVNVIASSNIINVAHTFVSGRRVRVRNQDGTLYVGLNSDTDYFISRIDANQFRLAFDEALTKFVTFSPKISLPFSTTDVEVSTNQITILNSTSRLRSGEAARLTATPGSTLPGGLATNTTYFVELLTGDRVRFHINSALTTPRSITTVGVGTFNLTQWGGTHTIYEYGGTHTLEKIPFSVAAVTRRRRLQFNNDTGVDTARLHVYIDGVQSALNLSSVPSAAYGAYRTYTTISGSHRTTNGACNYLDFTGSEEIGVRRDSVIEIINSSNVWSGTDSKLTRYNDDDGSYVPVYGIGLFADYKDGSFPSCGVVYQGRLVLSGFQSNGTLVIASGVEDILSRDVFYQFFQITNNLRLPEVDPFDFYTVGNRDIVALTVWQQTLFVFSTDSIFRTSAGAFTSVDKNIILVSNLGILNTRCVTVTSNSLLILTRLGVYDLQIVIENEYRAGELSAKIYNRLSGIIGGWIAYDKSADRVFIACSHTDEVLYDKMYVYDIFNQSWSEYGRFSTYHGFYYIDNVTKKYEFLVIDFTAAYVTYLKFNFNRFLDRCRVLVGNATVRLQIPAVSFLVHADVLSYWVDEPLVVYSGSFEDIYLTRTNIGQTPGQTPFVDERGFITFTQNPGDTEYFLYYNSGFFGYHFYRNNIEFTPNNLPESFNSKTSVTFTPSNVAGVNIHLSGHVYLSGYVSPVVTRESLSHFKRLRHLYVWFNQIRDYYSSNDTNVAGGQVPSQIVSKPRTENNANVGVLVHADNSPVVELDVFTTNSLVNETDSMLLKQALLGIGVSYQVVIWVATPEFVGFSHIEIDGSASSKFYVSGER